MQSTAAISLPDERRQALGRAVEVTMSALLGVPDPIVKYQRTHGAELDSAVLRAWVDQLHVWNMLGSVSGAQADDVQLFARSVEAIDERFAAIQAVSVQGATFGLRLDIPRGSEEEEWPYGVTIWKISTWRPRSGYLSDSEGEKIKDGSDGRTMHITVPARFEQLGEGLLRVNFYWDLDGGYWVPHMALVGGRDSAGKICPMLLF